jgi:hypothetical protein
MYGRLKAGQASSATGYSQVLGEQSGAPLCWGSEEVSMEESMLPKFGYYLDESDPDVVVLRRQDGAFVAAFSARGATREGIVEAAKEDYRELILAHAGSRLRRRRRRARPGLRRGPLQVLRGRPGRGRQGLL